MAGVALLAEGVDRNSYEVNTKVGELNVALLTEGVDRNAQFTVIIYFITASPSSRRAWIEMPIRAMPLLVVIGSPSSRRAWIEIA